ncbi:hypothetical protein Tco_0501886 [Tanacetum coccineum]
MEDLGLFTLPCRLWDSKPFDTLDDLGSCVNIIPLYLFKKLNIGLLEETDHIFGLTDGAKSYPVGIVKDVEKDPETPLLVGRGFLATANAVIDCRMAKIAVREGITRSVFRVKGVDLGEEEAPYWTTLGKMESYKPRPHSDGIGPQTPYYTRKDFLDCHLPREWEIARDESEDLIKKPINWDKPPKNGDGAWHTKIRLIDPDGKEFTKSLQSIPTTRKLSERESPRDFIHLDYFYDTKSHLLEDKQIPSVEVFSIWKAFGGNTHDFGSFREETDKTTDLHQHLSRLCSQQLETTSRITRDAITIHTKTAS